MTGVVTDSQLAPVAGASVIVIHAPSGTNYEATTRADGRFSIIGMRVGGPYIVTVAYTGTGTAFEPQTVEDLTVSLGVSTDVNVQVRAISVQETVTVIGQSDAVFSSTRTGAATAVSREQIATLPNLTNRLDNFTRLTPQASGLSMAGQDPRMNNITVDGSYFNNSFGLGNTPGDRTGVAPISPAGRRADPGQRGALRRAPGQLRRRRHQHRDAQRDQPVHRLGLSPVPRRRSGRHQGQGSRRQSRHLRLRQHRRSGSAARL